MKPDNQNIVDSMTGEDALRILRNLCASDPAVRKCLLAEAERVLADVDVDEVAESVLFDLDAISVEDLWDRSGASRHGYSSPDEMAAQMFEEALHPHEEEIKKYQKLSMSDQCMHYVMGTLKGIYRFEKEAESEFKDWATDVPAETFGFLLDEWRKDARKGDLKQMCQFVSEQCPEWARWVTKDRTTP